MEHITSSKRWLDYRTATTIVCWLGEHPYEPITYGVLAQKMASIFGEDPIHPLGFRCSLGRIQDECRHFGEPDDSAPCLPALVVTKATGRPGEGFYGVYCENRGKDPNDLDEHDRDALLESEQRHRSMATFSSKSESDLVDACQTPPQPGLAHKVRLARSS